MKNLKIVILLYSFIAIASCSKEDGGSNNNPPATKTKPTVTTTAITSITQTTASGGGNVTNDGGATVTARGICWSEFPSPTTSDSKTTNGTGKGSFTSSLTGLTASNAYYVRAYATNSEGTSYGTELTFFTLAVPCVTVTDIDGNMYCTKTIGTQTWMTKNLEVEHYRNGDVITPYTGVADWKFATTGRQLIFSVNIYGAYYNWYAVNDSRGLAPTGWHVATKDDYNTLYAYLGGTNSEVGPALKATGQWTSGGNNSSGFSALPGGFLDDYVNITDQDSHGYWWTSSSYSTPTTTNGIRFLLPDDNSMQLADRNRNYGIPVRCVKN